jgi:Carbohydrate family 9 binding domain-like
MELLVRITLLLVVLSGIGLALPEQQPTEYPPAKGYVAYRATKPIVIDGKLDDEMWKAVPWSEEFADIEGDKKPKPRHRTRMKMLWDDDALYIAAEMDEPHIWANLTQHDSVIFQDPDFEVFLDPDGDNHNYAEMELNAKNTTWDLLLSKPYKDGGKAINGWEIIGLQTAVHIDGTINDTSDLDKGWTVEIKWPYAGLKEIATANYPPKDGDQWRIGFSRVEWDVEIKDGKYVKVKGKPEYNWVWCPQGVIDMHRPERWGYVQFSNQKPGSVPFRLDPDAKTRDDLHRVYYAQREYREKNNVYTKTLADLGLAIPGVTLEVLGNRYEAKLGAYTITNDSLVTREKTR